MNDLILFKKSRICICTSSNFKKESPFFDLLKKIAFEEPLRIEEEQDRKEELEENLLEVKQDLINIDKNIKQISEKIKEMQDKYFLKIPVILKEKNKSIKLEGAFKKTNIEELKMELELINEKEKKNKEDMQEIKYIKSLIEKVNSNEDIIRFSINITLKKDIIFEKIYSIIKQRFANFFELFNLIEEERDISYPITLCLFLRISNKKYNIHDNFLTIIKNSSFSNEFIKKFGTPKINGLSLGFEDSIINLKSLDFEEYPNYLYLYLKRKYSIDDFKINNIIEKSQEIVKLLINKKMK